VLGDLLFDNGMTGGRIAWAPDGESFIAAPADPAGWLSVRGLSGTVTMWRRHNGFPGWHTTDGSALSVVVSPDGQLVAMGSMLGQPTNIFGHSGDPPPMPCRLRVLDASNGNELWHLSDHYAFEPVFSPDSHLLAVSDTECVRLLDARTGRELFNAGLSSELFLKSSFSADSRRLAVEAGALMVIDTGSMTRQWTVPSPCDAELIAFADGDRSLVVHGSLNRVAILNAMTGDVLSNATVEPVAPSWGLTNRDHPGAVLSPDGTRLLIGGADSVGMYDVKDGRRLFALLPGCGPHVFPRPKFSPDGRVFAFNAADGHPGVSLFQADTGNRLWMSRWEDGMVLDVAFNPSGDELAAGNNDHVRIFDVRRP
jgi:WD40 repeat protein